MRNMAHFIGQGKFTSIIERGYPFFEFPDAVCYVDAGHAAGKIVVEMPVH